jgi:cytochrome c-type biogenesis protein CcmH
MTLAFAAVAALMLLIALALVLRPVLTTPSDPRAAQRRALDRALADGVIDATEHAAKRAALDATPAPDDRRAPRPWGLAAALAVLLGGGAVAVYLTQGTPAALDPAARSAPDPGEMDRLLAALRQRLAEAPDDAAGWALLARSERTLGRLAEAGAAYARAAALAPDDADLLVEAAETIAMARPDRSLAGEPRALLERALATAPAHQRGLWLFGIAQAQAGDFAAAIETWTRLAALLPPGSEVAQAVAAQIAEARARLGDEADTDPSLAATRPEAAATSASPEPPGEPAPPAGTRLEVQVELAPALAARVPAGAVLFVFARAADGPRVPLAIQRLPASGFPVTVTLDDSQAMVAGMTLSSQPRLVVGARISASGNATPQPGDLEALSAPFEAARAPLPLRLTIDRVVP